MQVSTWHSDIAIQWQWIWLQTLVVIDSESCWKLFQFSSGTYTGCTAYDSLWLTTYFSAYFFYDCWYCIWMHIVHMVQVCSLLDTLWELQSAQNPERLRMMLMLLIGHKKAQFNYQDCVCALTWNSSSGFPIEHWQHMYHSARSCSCFFVSANDHESKQLCVCVCVRVRV